MLIGFFPISIRSDKKIKWVLDNIFVAIQKRELIEVLKKLENTHGLGQK